MPRPQRGDVIFTNRWGYNHYGIYVSDSEVIHYCKVEGEKKGNVSDNIIDDIKNTITCNGIIAKTSLDTFLDGGNLCICHFDESTIKKILDSDLLSAATFVLTGPISWGLRKVVNNMLDTDTEELRSAKKIYTPDETVARARKSVDKGGYNLVFHNCEHFAIWCKTGVSSSVQVKKIINLVSLPLAPRPPLY